VLLVVLGALIPEATRFITNRYDPKPEVIATIFSCDFELPDKVSEAIKEADIQMPAFRWAVRITNHGQAKAEDVTLVLPNFASGWVGGADGRKADFSDVREVNVGELGIESVVVVEAWADAAPDGPVKVVHGAGRGEALSPTDMLFKLVDEERNLSYVALAIAMLLFVTALWLALRSQRLVDNAFKTLTVTKEEIEALLGAHQASSIQDTPKRENDQRAEVTSGNDETDPT
jgi:hypothetical protein